MITVNYPLEYFARRIGGDLVEVVLPAPSNVDPAYWKPDESTIEQIQQADLILINGAGYADWLARVAVPESKLVDTTAAVSDQLIEVSEGIVHSHGPGGEHSHTGYAITTWLDPRIALAQANAVHAALVERLPDDKEKLDANFELLSADLTALDQRLDAVAKAYDGRPLLASHPIYQYLARRAKLNLQSVHWEPEEEPTESQWKELAEQIGDHEAHWMLWEATPLQETADRLDALGIECVVYAPCGSVPANGDFLVAMQENVDRLASIVATDTKD